ncbi:condensation domain-containing protein [Chlorogloeopsis sp. ULAP01]|uniref:condensation domain-containing protein n=1 Tax=Chlorogloeopsis sp. ULAP01 TaxID=3056483 RepID=UPI0025AB55E1|nr:condensation domain-containing protein [Chlorogloeopsis sp. ULAP01]MDM9384968.1 condensation domain-containing protein [Chlorogloeopsis sp. ULAP01]
MNSLNRKLGLVENLFKILNDLGSMIDVNVARIEGQLTPDILQQALNLVQKRHPMLQVHIVESSDGAYFNSEGTSKIPLHIINKQDENQWLEIAEDELHKKFSASMEPLCRVTFLPSSTSNGTSEIIATFHHAVTDGMSCMRFFDDLLSYCQQITDGEDIDTVVTMELLLPLEKMLANNLPSHNQAEEAQEKSHRENHSPKLIIEEEASPSQRRTCLVTKILRKDITVLLKERCKQEKTTVHGALCAAMLLETAKIVFRYGNIKNIKLSCGSNVNLRKFCQPEVMDKHIGCFISGIEEIHCLEKDTHFWDLARECKLKINQSTNSKLPLFQVSNADNFRKFNKDFLNKASVHNMGRSTTTHISNRGQFNLPEKYGSFKLKELYFATGQHIVGTCFWLGVVTFHEHLFCTFAYVIPLVSVKTAKQFADSVMDTIQKACIS